MSPRPSLAVLLLCAGVLAGCGTQRHAGTAVLGRPFQSSAPAAALVTPAPAPQGDPLPERGGTITPGARAALERVAPAGLAPSPTLALRRYAELYINWSAAMLPARERQLAALAVGAAKLEAQQTASARGGAAVLLSEHVSNSGQIIAIAPGQGPEQGQWVIVTQEQTTGRGPYAGLPAGPHVTLARTVHERGGWAISAWDPIS